MQRVLQLRSIGLTKTSNRRASCGVRWASAEAIRSDTYGDGAGIEGKDAAQGSSAGVFQVEEAKPGSSKPMRAAAKANVPAGKLSRVLRKQRLALQGGASYSDAELARELEAIGNAKNTQNDRPKTDGRKPKVDLFINESSYPQSRIVEEDLGSRRKNTQRHNRAHLAPALEATQLDPLSALARPTAPQRPTRARSQPRDGSYSRPSQRAAKDVDTGSPTSFTSRFAPVSTHSPLAGSRSTRSPESTNRSRRAGKATGRTRTERAPRASRDLSPRDTPKELSPPPTSVLDQHGRYLLAKPFTPGNKQSLAPVSAQLRVLQKDIGALAEPRQGMPVAKGDWANYLAPIFKNRAQKSNVETASINDRARLVIAANSSMMLRDKIELTSRIGQHL